MAAADNLEAAGLVDQATLIRAQAEELIEQVKRSGEREDIHREEEADAPPHPVLNEIHDQVMRHLEHAMHDLHERLGEVHRQLEETHHRLEKERHSLREEMHQRLRRIEEHIEHRLRSFHEEEIEIEEHRHDNDDH